MHAQICVCIVCEKERNNQRNYKIYNQVSLNYTLTIILNRFRLMIRECPFKIFVK